MTCAYLPILDLLLILSLSLGFCDLQLLDILPNNNFNVKFEKAHNTTATKILDQKEEQDRPQFQTRSNKN